jgi:hypothetical protein
MFIKVVTRIFKGKGFIWAAGRSFCIVLIFLGGFATIYRSFDSITLENVFRKDFFQDYLFARAILAGLNPYLPLPILKEAFFLEVDTLIFPHPTPHPPMISLFIVPFGLLEYQVAATIWLALSVVLFTYAILEMSRRFLLITNTTLLWFFVLLALGTRVIQIDLIVGQFNAIILLSCTMFLISLVNKNYIISGIWLGVSLSVKLFGVPILLYLCLKRKWLVVISALMVFITANLASGLIVGWDNIIKYYPEISTRAADYYNDSANNFSIWTIGQRLFGELQIGGEVAESFIEPVSLIVIILSYIAVLYLSFKANEEVVSIAILVIGTALLQPITWAHGFSVAWLSVFIAFKLLLKLKLPEVLSSIGFVIFCFFYIGDLIAISFVGRDSIMYALASISPMVTMISLAIYLYWLDRHKSSCNV